MSRRNRDDVDRFHDYGIYLPSRTLYMGSEIVGDDTESGTDALMAERMIKNLHILDKDGEEITIIMNNLGGDVMHGMAIYDAIKACRSNVVVKAMGNAMSMGSVILQAADERIMAANAVQMIHIGYFGTDGHAKTAYRQADEAKRLDKIVEKIYLDKIREKHPEFSSQRLKGMLDHDTYLSAAQSIELGLADKIMGEN